MAADDHARTSCPIRCMPLAWHPLDPYRTGNTYLPALRRLASYLYPTDPHGGTVTAVNVDRMRRANERKLDPVWFGRHLGFVDDRPTTPVPGKVAAMVEDMLHRKASDIVAQWPRKDQP